MFIFQEESWVAIVEMLSNLLSALGSVPPSAVLPAIAGLIVVFLVKLVGARRKIYRLQAKGMVCYSGVVRPMADG